MRRLSELAVIQALDLIPNLIPLAISDFRVNIHRLVPVVAFERLTESSQSGSFHRPSLLFLELTSLFFFREIIKKIFCRDVTRGISAIPDFRQPRLFSI